MSALPAVTPLPPRVAGWPGALGAGPGLLRNPTAFLARARARHGDTFVVDALGYRLCFVFSPAGVAALYAVPENVASFGLATFELVFRPKLPVELVAGRRNRPHDLFKNPDVETYLGHLEEAVDREIATLGASGRFEAFELSKRLGYRMGLASWAGPEAASDAYLLGLIEHFEVLDAADSFVRPLSTLWSRVTGKRREWRAMAGIEAAIAEILASRRAGGARPGDFLDHIDESFADLTQPDRDIAVARDLMVLQMGAQSNLYAALAWTLVHLLERPELLARVRAGDDALLERCALESIRLRQRSLTLRRVLQPFVLESEAGRFELAPGVMLATMLSVTNPTAAPGFDRFDPERWQGWRLAEGPLDAGRERVSTFGHGRHSCPARRFSISAIRVALSKLVGEFELTPGFAGPQPSPRQIGGVARADRPCPVAYRRSAAPAAAAAVTA